MPRQVRIEYPGALYHVMARGNRKEDIFLDDGDRHAFLKALGDMCTRSEIFVHAYVLMPNHYHLVLETPLGNLTDGMRWLQNTYTRRFNVYHKLWGHIFGGRYKALVLEDDPFYFSRVLDYVHLNPVRANLLNEGDPVESYPWSSLPAIVQSPRLRPAWLKADRVFAAQGMGDTPATRKAYLEHLHQAARRGAPSRAGVPAREDLPGNGLQTSIQRGWYFGSRDFKNRLLEMLEKPGEARHAAGDGYHGEQMQDRGQAYAEKLLARGCAALGLDAETLRERKPGDPEKVLLAEQIASLSTVRLDWLREALGMGSRSYCSRLVNELRKAAEGSPELQRKRDRLRKALQGK